MPTFNIRPNTEITMAWTQAVKAPWCAAYPLKVYDDWVGRLWLFGEEYGPTMLIRARSFADAWEIMLDESPTIPESDVPEAYGYHDNGPIETAKQRLDADVKAAIDGVADYPELLEGYEYQPNSSGTGIVSVSEYAWLREFEYEDFERYHIGLQIEVFE
jgi:hypothetical protein